MLINAEWLLNEIANYLLPFCRLAGFLMVVSLFSSKSVSPRFRMILAVAITLVVVPTLPQFPIKNTFGLSTFILVMEQSLIGILMGFVSRLLLETFVVGAQITAMQSGLGFASLVDPANGNSVPALGQFFLIMTTLLFVAVDGHLLMVRLVVESFHSVPIGSSANLSAMLIELVLWSRWIFAAAVTMALVAIASLLMVNIAFGVMTRAAPQVNVFVVGFPLTMLAGLILLWLTLSFFLPHFDNQLSRATGLVCSMVLLDC